MREAGAAREAMRVLHQHLREIDLLLVDVAMPGISGIELVRHLRSVLLRCPPVVLMSSYARHDVARLLGPLPELPFLRKPFTGEVLHRAVREALRSAQHLTAAAEITIVPAPPHQAS